MDDFYNALTPTRRFADIDAYTPVPEGRMVPPLLTTPAGETLISLQ